MTPLVVVRAVPGHRIKRIEYSDLEQISIRLFNLLYWIIHPIDSQGNWYIVKIRFYPRGEVAGDWLSG